MNVMPFDHVVAHVRRKVDEAWAAEAAADAHALKTGRAFDWAAASRATAVREAFVKLLEELEESQ